jgi:hypothetical protein
MHIPLIKVKGSKKAHFDKGGSKYLLFAQWGFHNKNTYSTVMPNSSISMLYMSVEARQPTDGSKTTDVKEGEE